MKFTFDRRVIKSPSRQANVPVTLAELEARLLQSIERLDRGEGIDGEAAFRRLRRRIKEACANDRFI